MAQGADVHCRPHNPLFAVLIKSSHTTPPPMVEHSRHSQRWLALLLRCAAVVMMMPVECGRRPTTARLVSHVNETTQTRQLLWLAAGDVSLLRCLRRSTKTFEQHLYWSSIVDCFVLTYSDKIQNLNAEHHQCFHGRAHPWCIGENPSHHRHNRVSISSLTKTKHVAGVGSYVLTVNVRAVRTTYVRTVLEY